MAWAGVPPGCGHASIGTASGTWTATPASRGSASTRSSPRSIERRSPGNGVFGGRILTLEDYSPLPAPGRAAALVITPGNVLRPESVHELVRLTSDDRARARLVPIPRRKPESVLAPRYRAGESVLQLLTMGLFAERAPEFVNHGGIEVRERDWRALADRAGLPYAMVQEDVLPAWTAGEGRFLAVDRARWTLGPSYEDERRHLELIGGMRARAAERGRRGAQRRYAKPKTAP